MFPMKTPKQRIFSKEIHIFVVFSLIFGLWPSWKGSKYESLLAIYSIFSISIVFYIFISAIFINKILDDNTLSIVVDFSLVMSILATHFIIILQAFFHRRKLLQITNKFTYVDRLFNEKLFTYIPYKKEKRSIWIRISILLGVLVIMKIVLILRLHYRNEFGSFWYHCLYSILIMRLRCCQLLFLIFSLQTRLNLLSDKLKEILVARSSLYTGNTIEWHLVFNITNVISILDISPIKHAVHDQLLDMKHIYGELHEICELINDIFGWYLLAIITQCFIDFTSNRQVFVLIDD